MFIVTIDDGSGIVRQNVGEKTLLRAHIVGKRWVIIQMIARDVGESGSLDGNAIQPILSQPMTGGFQCHIINLFLMQPLQPLSQSDGIGRGEM